MAGGLTVAGYNPDSRRERLEAERALVAGNLAAYRKQMAPGLAMPPSLADAIKRAQLALDRIDQELVALS